MKKRAISILLTLCMVVSLLPTSVLAAESGQADGQTVFYVDEEIPVSLSMSGNVTISGYMDEDDWYVTDGLALMYDGIYNAGMNNTASSAAVWKELTGNGGDITNLTAANNGMKTGSSNSGKADISIDTTGFTYNAAFSASNMSDVKAGDGSAYFAAFAFENNDKGEGHLGTVRPDGTTLNYHGGVNSVFGSLKTSLSDNELVELAITSNGTDERCAYLNGALESQSVTDGRQENKALPETNYTLTKVYVPVNNSLPSAADASAKNVTLYKTVYGLRLYTRPLSQEELDQNRAVDEARYGDGTYEVPGTVTVGSNAATLTECTFDNGTAHVGETTVEVGSDGALTLQLKREGTYTLKFQSAGNQTETKTVKIISKANADAAVAAKSLIEALPAADALILDDLNDVAAAQAAYEALSDVQKELVGDEAAEKLKACVAKMDELAKEGLKITLDYDANGGTVSAASAEIQYGKSYTLEIPTRKNFHFDGWYLGSTQLTGADGKSLSNWDSLKGGRIVAHWTNNAELSGEVLEISRGEDIYALARILSGIGSTDDDYALFGYTKSAANQANLQKAAYILTNDIELTDQE